LEEKIFLKREEEFATAKETRAKEAQQAAAAAKEEAAAQAKVDAEAAAAVKRQVEAKAKADAHAEATDKHSNGEEQAHEAFLKRAASKREKAEVTGADSAAGLSDKIKDAKMASAKPQVATTNLPGMPMSSDTDELDISDSEPPLTASGGKGSVVHRDVTSAELAAQIAMLQDVGDTNNKFCASKLSLGNPSESTIYGRCLGSRHTFLKSL
jgi:colicin import membrane protein